MKTAQEILIENAAARLSREEEDKKWSAIIKACRTPVWPAVVNLISWMGVMGMFLAIDRPAGLRPIHALPFVFLFIGLSQLLSACARRKKGLLAAIQYAAPELHEKLQRDSVP